MTGASGKKNRMFVTKNIPRHSSWLILFSVFLCLSHLQAQQQTEQSDQSFLSPAKPEQNPDSTLDPVENRRVDRSEEAGVAAGNRHMVLPDEKQNQQLQQLLSSLATHPEDLKKAAQLHALLQDVLGQANRLIDAGFINQAKQLLDLIRSLAPDLAGLAVIEKRLETYNETNRLLIAGNAALESQRILEPENGSALYYFKLALSKDPQNPSAQKGLSRVQAKLIEQALESARELDFETAEDWLSEASTVQKNQKYVDNARFEVTAFKRERAVELEQKALTAMSTGDFTRADFSIIDLIALGGNEAGVESLRARLKEARFYGGFVPGQIVTDEFLQSGDKAPQIVVIAAGSFLMGSAGRSDDNNDHEKPQHRVSIGRGFGLGTREVTVEQFQLFVERSGYRTTAELRGSSSVYDEAAGRLSKRGGVNWRNDYKGREAKPGMPVLHVSMLDAQAYAQWLALATGKAYRLPSEAEYEYVARAGGNANYWWGRGSPAETVENLTGERDLSSTKRQWTTSFKKYGDGYWGPGPTGSIGNGKLVHPMGVFDIAGNVSEWTEDCWHQNYVKAPVDGSAWVNPGCKRRVVRGGYWASAPEQSRAAFRFPVKAESYGPVIGFRIARDL